MSEDLSELLGIPPGLYRHQTGSLQAQSSSSSSAGQKRVRDERSDTPLRPDTLVFSHEQCTSHITPKLSPEQPDRVKSILRALRLRAHSQPGLFELVELKTSEHLLNALEAQLLSEKESAALGQALLLNADAQALPLPRVCVGEEGRG